jgi:hypothetical protein
MPLVTLVIGNFDGGKKLLNYIEYTKNSDMDAHVHVFKEAIKVNGVTQVCMKIVYFQLTLRDTTLTWGNNFVNNHPNCNFNKFAQMLCRRYRKVQTNEQVYMTLKIIKQILNERVEEYYE